MAGLTISKAISAIIPCECGKNNKIEGGRRGANLVFYIGALVLAALAGLVLSGAFPKLAINLGTTGVKGLGATLVIGGAIMLAAAVILHRGSCRKFEHN